MAEKQKLKCPVCGSEKPEVSLNRFGCDTCGFSLAYVTKFASQKSLDTWNASVQKAVEARMQQAAEEKKKQARQQSEQKEEEEKRKRTNLRKFVRENRLSVSDNTFSYLSKKGTLFLISGNGTLQEEHNVKQVSLSQRNIAILYQNHTVKVIGSDNGLGQQNTQDWKEIQYVLATADATYGITRDRKVVVAGASAHPSITEWTNVKELYEGNGCIWAIDYDYGIRNTLGEHSDWDDKFYIERAAVSDRALLLWGDVEKDKKRDYQMRSVGTLADNKKDILNVSRYLHFDADRFYVYVLHTNMEMELFGQSVPFLDQGRSSAEKWNSIISLSANQTGVAGLTKSGSLLYAGAVSGDLKAMRQTWTNEVQPIVREDLKGLL